MHNYTVAQNASPTQLLANMAILEQAVSNDIYSYWFNAEMLGDGGHASGATYTAATLSSPSYWALADGVTSGITGYVRRHGEWRCGVFKVKVHWSSSVAGNAVRLGVDVVPVLENAAAPTFAVTVAKTVDAPATANHTKVTEFTTSPLSERSAMDASKCGVIVSVRRAGGNAADTNTGTVSVYGVELLYVESKHVVGSAFIR